MFGYKYYVPILKGKMGEFRAVSHLPAQIRAKLTPFFDIPRPDDNWRDRFDDYLIKKASDIHSHWGIADLVFVDYFDFDLTLRTSLGQHHVQFSFDGFRNYGVQAIPVTGLDRDDDYNMAVAQTVALDKRGVAVRLQKEDIEDPSSTQAGVKDLLVDLNVRETDVHLILDFRELHGNGLSQEIDDATEFLANFGNLKEIKTLSLSASGFPQHMGGVQKHSSQLLPRTELDLWERVLAGAKRKDLTRFPAFSDYGIRHPDILDFDLAMNPGV